MGILQPLIVMWSPHLDNYHSTPEYEKYGINKEATIDEKVMSVVWNAFAKTAQ